MRSQWSAKKFWIGPMPEMPPWKVGITRSKAKKIATGGTLCRSQTITPTVIAMSNIKLPQRNAVAVSAHHKFLKVVEVFKSTAASLSAR